MTAISHLQPQTVPPLQNGDRLTRDEFERRYEAMPTGTKAELVEGVVYIVSPVTETFHGSPHLLVNFWIGLYWAATPGLIGGTESTLRLDLDNEPQPDAYLRVASEHGGQSKLDPDGFVEGAPELVFEVVASSASYDVGDKLESYRRNGVLEYLVWRIYDQAIDWFVLREGSYQKSQAGPDGIYHSEIYPSLWLDQPAFLRGDLAQIMQVSLRGTGSPEHLAFVQQLQNRKATAGD